MASKCPMREMSAHGMDLGCGGAVLCAGVADLPAAGERGVAEAQVDLPGDAAAGGVHPVVASGGVCGAGVGEGGGGGGGGGEPGLRGGAAGLKPFHGGDPIDQHCIWGV